jgi:hypothetical protein
MSNESDT